MKLKAANAPHLRRQDRVTAWGRDVLIALCPLILFSCIYYGIRPLIMVLVPMATAAICESVCCLLMRRKNTLWDLTALATGALIGALMSPLTDYWVPALAAAFAIIVVKMPFGGWGRQLFSPAAAGMALVTQCFPTRIFTYPDARLATAIPWNSTAGVLTVASPAAQLSDQAVPALAPSALVLGNFSGPIGATAILVLLACMIYLFIRRSASPLIVLPYLAVCALVAAFVPRVDAPATTSLMLELSSGYLLFAGVFLLTETPTAPRSWLGRIVYGALAGLLVMLLRSIGVFEEGACFAILIINAFAPLIDRICWRFCYRIAHPPETA